MSSAADIARNLVPGSVLPGAAAYAGASALIVVSIIVAVLVLYYAWRVYERPELAERWVALLRGGDRRDQ